MWYIKRVHGEDNRYNEVEITSEGEEIVKKTKELFAAADRSLFEGFTDEELDGYINCIEKIYHNIRKQLPGAECCGGKANEKMV